MSTAPQGWQTPKTNWQAADIVHPSDFNRIEGNIQAIESGSRTLDPSQVPSGNSGSLRQILSWFANRIRAITGATNWYDAPATTLAAAAEHAARTDNPHGVTKAQVGLGNVENYGIATQAEAEAGSVNNKYMTPLRTKQAIDAAVMVATGEAWDGATLPVFPGYSRHYYLASFNPDHYEPFLGYQCWVDQNTRKLTSRVRTHSSGQYVWATRPSQYIVIALK